MIRHIKLLFFLLLLLFVTAQAPLAHADGGLVFEPYWKFLTEDPVTHVATGDIDGDGVLEVVAVADNIVYVLENDGTLAWRYEKEGETIDLLVENLDSDAQTAEIYVGGARSDTILGDADRSVWTRNYSLPIPPEGVIATDMDGDGRHEVLYPTNMGIRTVHWVQDTYINRDILLGPRSTDLWVGDVHGDTRPELVLSPESSSQISVFTDNGHQIWGADTGTEVSLVQGGDVDGDGRAEVVVLGTDWELVLFDGDGNQLWRQPALSANDAGDRPQLGQLMIRDLDGDSRLEILVMSPAPAAAVQVFSGAGHQIWQHPLNAIASPARLTAGDIDGDGQAEVLVTTVGQEQVYLLNGSGERLAQYHTSGTTGGLAYADVNNDGWGEVIVGTETGVELFGTSTQVARRRLWQSRRLQGTVTALDMLDPEASIQEKLFVGTHFGLVFGLADDGQILWDLDLGTIVQDVQAGDTDGDGQHEIVVVTAPTGRGDNLFLLDDRQLVWSARVGGLLGNSLVVRDLDDDGRAEIIVGTDTGGSGRVRRFDGQGRLIWQYDFVEAIETVGSEGSQVLVGGESGQVYRLTAKGAPAGEIDLGTRVLSLADGLAATAGGQVYHLGSRAPTLAYNLGHSPNLIQVGLEAALTGPGGKISLVTNEGVIWQGTVEGKLYSLTTGDLDDHGAVEIAVGTDDSRVHLFGATLNQPPFLSKPGLVETRTGYSYSVNVNDPEADAVPIALEIWDPSAATWRPQPPQTLPSGQAQGRLTWDVSEPFDSWDSGQENRFRFSYDFDDQPHLALETAGPLTIPTTPWYVFYGQRIGLVILVLLIPIFGFVFYYRQRAYRRSPVGRADTLLKRLRTHPQEAFLSLHDLARDQPTQLSYLPSLAREAGEPNIADLSEGFHLILTRPDVAAEGLQAILAAVETLAEPSDQQAAGLIRLYQLFRQALQANTVARIVTFRPHLADGDPGADALPEFASSVADLSRVTETLNNSQRVETVADKTAYLAQAFESLDHLQRQFPASLPQPEANILGRIAAAWTRAVTTALQDLQGRAQIEVALKTRQLLNLEQATLPLELTNSGRSPASNITVTLVPDRAFAVGNGTAQIDILPAGRSAVVEMDISAASSVDQFRAEFNITFDDREQTGKALAFADRVQLLKPDAEFQPMPNPYAPGTPLAPGSPIFFGRDDLFQFISENISGLAHQNILVLIGQRRMGKTSFLQQLPARLGQAYLPVYVDGQSLGIDPGMANFFYDLALAMVDALADQGIELEEPLPEDFKERPSATFDRGAGNAGGFRQVGTDHLPLFPPPDATPPPAGLHLCRHPSPGSPQYRLLVDLLQHRPVQARHLFG
jgi:hypothetical protein